MCFNETTIKSFLFIVLWSLCSASSTTSTRRIGQEVNYVLAGPEPNGWKIQHADAQEILDEIFLALDVGSVGELNSISLQRSVFQTGLRRNNTKMSLRDLGITAGNFSVKSPLFHYYVDAFEEIGVKYEKEEKGLFDEHPASEYLSTIIQDLLSLNMPSDIIKDSSLVMNIFIRVHTYMENVNNACTTKDPEDALINLDHAAALWIGFGQTYGDNYNGNMLYGLTERAGANFGQDHVESKVNTEILSLMSEIRSVFIDSFSNPSEPAFPCSIIRQKVARVQALFFVPLVQNLIHYMWNGDGNYVELYSLSILPLLRTCDPRSFDSLINNLVLKTFQDSTMNSTLTQVQSLYSCMDLKCDDIGEYLNGLVPECSDSLNEQPPTFWQDYSISSNDSAKFAKVDRDIRQMDILLQRSQYDLALDLYSYGRNMRSVRDGDIPTSLRKMSEQASEDTTTFLHLYEEYFVYKNLGDVDTFIRDILNDYNSDSKKELVLRLLQTIVTPHYAFRNFFGSMKSCKTGDLNISSQSWDIGAAVILGSIPKDSDASQSARLRTTWYSLSLEMCQNFGCNAVLAHTFTRSLELGKAAIIANNCTDLQAHVDMMKTLLFVPIIHGALDAAVRLENNASDPIVVGSARAYALAVAPLVDNVSKSASNQIYNRLATPDIGSVNGTVDDVFKAFARSWYGLGIDCSLIGTYLSSSTSFCAFIDTVEPETTAPTASPVEGPIRSPTLSPFPSTLPDLNLLHPSFSGRYNFTYNVTTELLLAIDISNMSSSNLSEANDLYVKSFSGMTKNVSSYLNTNPYYSFYSYAFKDDPNLPTDSVKTYSSAIVTEALTRSNGGFASETVLVMIVWMNIVNLLYSAVADCKQNIPPLLNIDAAIALYIGADQTMGNTDGYMLYNLGQKYALEYNTIGTANEANANNKIVEAFVAAKTASYQCGEPKISQWIQLRRIVQSIIAQMNVPLLQALDHYISQFSITFDRDDGDHLKLFALATLPQYATCLPKLYDQFFRTSLIDKNFLVTSDSEKSELWQSLSEAKMILTNTYSCFGLNTNEILGISSGVRLLYDYNLPLASVEYSYLDRDILKIEALLYFGSTELALELYEHGFSSTAGSLQMLARDPKRASSEEFLLYMSFFSDEFYADSIILSAFQLEQHPHGTHATLPQANTTIAKAAQTMVLFTGSLQHMYSAINLCRSSAVGESVAEWDKSFALFKGSAIEFEGSTASDYGLSLYSLAKAECLYLNTCPEVDNIIGTFVNGKDLLFQSSCDGASQIVKEMIIPSILITFIQATLHASNKIEEGYALGDDMYAIAAGNIYALSMIPLVNSVDTDAAKKISLNLGVDANALFKAFQSVLPSFHIMCEDLGTIRAFNIDGCDSSSGENTLFPGPAYKTVTNVTNLAKIDLDVKLILDALLKDEAAVAERIYTNGFYSSTAAGKLNLANFSLQAASTMANQSTYNLYKFAFSENTVPRLSDDTGSYGDRLVRSFFDDSSIFSLATSASLPVEAAIAMNLWLHVTYQLHSAVTQCQLEVADVSYIDAAAAYWIGSIPLTDNATQGFLLYSLTEKASDWFEQRSSGRASPINVKLLELFKQATLLLTSPRACQGGSTTASHLRSVIFQCISQMTIPLIQHLIANLKLGDRARVKIYAHALVPLLVGCRSSAFLFLKSKLIDSSYSDADVVEIISTIEGAYDCLGLSCGDIGSYNGIRTCVDVTASSSIAGFVPSTDIRAISKLDLDVKEIEIMIAMGATPAAKDIYFNGKHSPLRVTTGGHEFLSLYNLAIDEERNIVPDFKLFTQYYHDSQYAHTTIGNIISAIRDNTYSKIQGSLLVRNTLSYLILSMASLQRLYSATSHCNTGAVINARTLWNEAAALLIGSLEGSNEEGIADDDGYLSHFWANYLCSSFGVCDMGYARVNRVIILLFNSGRAALDADQCAIAQDHALQISKNLLVPFIQGSLLYSSEASLIHSKDSHLYDFVHTAGYISSRYVLPYVYSVNPQGASLIEHYLDFDLNNLNDDRTSTREVFRVLEEAIIQMSGIDCSDVGYLKDVQLGVCRGQLGDPSASHERSSSVRWLWLLLVLLLFGLFIWCDRRKERKVFDESQPEKNAIDEEEITVVQDSEHRID